MVERAKSPIGRGTQVGGDGKWVYQTANKPLPEVGSLSIVTDGRGDPVCVVETITVDMKGFAEVDATFAYDYGAWDRTLETWRAHCWKFNAPRSHA
ncbi:MAG: ASCH domain-containing protein [Candidatus Tectomicrobia bacterium]